MGSYFLKHEPPEFSHCRIVPHAAPKKGHATLPLALETSTGGAALILKLCHGKKGGGSNFFLAPQNSFPLSFKNFSSFNKRVWGGVKFSMGPKNPSKKSECDRSLSHKAPFADSHTGNNVTQKILPPSQNRISTWYAGLLQPRRGLSCSSSHLIDKISRETTPYPKNYNTLFISSEN